MRKCLQSMQVVDEKEFSSLGENSIARLNGALAAALSTCDGASVCPKEGTPKAIRALLGDQGPFWLREYAFDKEPQVCTAVTSLICAS